MSANFDWLQGRRPKEENMKLLRIVAVAALTAFGGITGGTCIVHATPATGVLLGAPAVKTLQTPTMGTLPLEQAYYYY